MRACRPVSISNYSPVRTTIALKVRRQLNLSLIASSLNNNRTRSPRKPVSDRFTLPPSCSNLICRILRYHICATGALYGSGAIPSSSTRASFIRATLAFGSGTPASSGLLRFRPNFPLPAVATFLIFFAPFLAYFAASFIARSARAFSRSS